MNFCKIQSIKKLVGRKSKPEYLLSASLVNYKLYFLAPEVISFRPISLASDMWSMGVITYVLLSGLSPFMGDNDFDTLKNVSVGDYDYEDDDGIFDAISEEAKQFIDARLQEKKMSHRLNSKNIYS